MDKLRLLQTNFGESTVLAIEFKEILLSLKVLCDLLKNSKDLPLEDKYNTTLQYFNKCKVFLLAIKETFVELGANMMVKYNDMPKDTAVNIMSNWIKDNNLAPSNSNGILIIDSNINNCSFFIQLLIIAFSRYIQHMAKIVSLIKQNEIFIRALIKYVESINIDEFVINDKVLIFAVYLYDCDILYKFHVQHYLKLQPYKAKWNFVKYENCIFPSKIYLLLDNVISDVDILIHNDSKYEIYMARCNILFMEFKRTCFLHTKRIEHAPNNITFLNCNGICQDKIGEDFINLFKIASTITLMTKNYSYVFMSNCDANVSNVVNNTCGQKQQKEKKNKKHKDKQKQLKPENSNLPKKNKDKYNKNKDKKKGKDGKCIASVQNNHVAS